MFPHLKKHDKLFVDVILIEPVCRLLAILIFVLRDIYLFGFRVALQSLLVINSSVSFNILLLCRFKVAFCLLSISLPHLMSCRTHWIALLSFFHLLIAVITSFSFSFLTVFLVARYSLPLLRYIDHAFWLPSITGENCCALAAYVDHQHLFVFTESHIHLNLKTANYLSAGTNRIFKEPGSKHVKLTFVFFPYAFSWERYLLKTNVFKKER